MVAAAERAYVALGSNLGDRAGHLAAARAALGEAPGHRGRGRVGRRGDGAARRHAAAALPQPDGRCSRRASRRGSCSTPATRSSGRGAASAASDGAPGPSMWTSCNTASGA